MAPKKAPVVKLPPILPKGHILHDKNKKKHWILGKQIGTGGFGRIYEVHCTETSEDAVVKMEHLNSGPLFCEQNFAVRCLKKEMLSLWAKKLHLTYVPLPEFYSFGVTDDGFRYVVMQRLGRNLEEVLKVFDWKMPDILTYQVAIQMLFALQFIHENNFVHADVKGSNIIFGFGNNETKHVYLCDFGLAAKVPTVYKEDKKLKHNGTVEYTSREAHRGAAPSPRGDFEILAYCLLHWMFGKLPWGAVLSNCETVSTAKHSFFDKLPNSLTQFFPKCSAELIEFFMFVSRMRYEAVPDYNAARKIFSNGLHKRKVSSSQPFQLKEVKAKGRRSMTKQHSQEAVQHRSHAKAEGNPASYPVPAQLTRNKTTSFVAPSGPLAIAVARNQAQTESSANGMPLKRLRTSPRPSPSMLNGNGRTPSARARAELVKSRIVANLDDSDSDLYKTALQIQLPSDDEDDDDDNYKPPVVTRRPLSNRRKPRF